MRSRMNEIIFGNRILTLNCYEKSSRKVMDYFTRTVKRHEESLLSLMDKYKIPPQVIIHLRRGNYTLDGEYKVQSKIVSKHLIVLEIYIERWMNKKGRELEDPEIEKDLIHTFVHELIHHKYESERETERRAKEFLKKINLDPN